MEEKLKGQNLAQKILNVTRALSGVATLAQVRAAMIKQKLIAQPSQVSCTRVKDLTTIQVAYTLIDQGSGEETTTYVFGQGQDKGDKGTLKARNDAELGFFSKTFMVSIYKKEDK